MEKAEGKSVLKGLVLMVAVAGLTGCQTYNQQNTFGEFYKRGDLAGAQREATAKALDTAEGKDAIVWRLEEASILRAAGKYEESNRSFDMAQARIDKYSEEAKTKISNEAGALLSNQANLPYRGRAYDGIMLNTYKALNYLQMGDPDRARVELIRAYQRQQDAVEANKRTIEKTQEEASKLKESDQKAIAKARENDKFKGEMDSNFSDLDKLQPYGDYVNPFSVYLDGLFYMATATSPSDVEHAQKSFERASAFSPNNSFLKADLEAIQGVLAGKAIPPTTYVIFETGCGPIRDQIRIDIPIIVVSVSYVGAAFPKLKYDADYASTLTVSAGGASSSSEVVASMDSVVGRDFKNELPTIITKTLASTITKALATTAINEAARQADSTAYIVSKIATAGYQAAVNIADCRTWTTLPKEFQVCRVPTPADRKLDLTASGGQKTSVTVGEGTFNLVYVKCINGTGPLHVSQIKLK
jgi:hypothetical protein